MQINALNVLVLSVMICAAGCSASPRYSDVDTDELLEKQTATGKEIERRLTALSRWHELQVNAAGQLTETIGLHPGADQTPCGILKRQCRAAKLLQKQLDELNRELRSITEEIDNRPHLQE